MKTCPFCAEEIQDAAIVCKHCGRNLPHHSLSPVVSAATPPEIHFQFTGKGSDFLTAGGLKLLLEFLFIVTIPLGLVALARWMVRHIRISTGTTGSFAGTAQQATAFAVSFFFLALLKRWDFSDADVFKGAPLLLLSTAILWMSLLMALNAYVAFALLRWEIQKTELSPGAALMFSGSFWGVFGWQTLGIVSVLTIVGWAWVTAAYFRWLCRNTRAGSFQGEFTGRGSEVLWRGTLAVLGCIPIVTIPWMYCWWFRWFWDRVKGTPVATSPAFASRSRNHGYP